VPVATASVEAQSLTSVIIINVPVAMAVGAAIAPEVRIAPGPLGYLDATASLDHALTADLSLALAISADVVIEKLLAAEVSLAPALVSELVS
jgi:hypothetical protein